MNANLFAALKLEKVGMFILLAMVVLIGSFSIVTTLVMLVMEKTRDIAIMMSMGATRRHDPPASSCFRHYHRRHRHAAGLCFRPESGLAAQALPVHQTA